MSRRLARTADCVIIGGGAVGCSLAYHLSRRGGRPLLLEGGELGSGSTGRCAGGVRQQFSTEINVRVGMLSRRLLARFPDEIGATAGYRPIGYLLLTRTEAERRQLVRNVAMQRAAGLEDVQALTPLAAAAMVPGLRSDDLTAASFCPSDGVAGPHEVTTGYAAAAERLGATIVQGSAVEAIDRDGAGVRGVVCQGERIASPLVIDCAGPGAAAVAALAGVVIPVEPHRRHLFLTEPLRWAASLPMTVDLHSTFYCHPEGEGLLMGMSDPAEPASFDTTVSWDFLEKLIPQATWRIPALADAGIRTGWAGLYEMTPDRQAIVGEAPGVAGLWLCCGFSGHGFMQAPAIGRLVAEWICTGSTEIPLGAFAPGRFEGGALDPELAVI